MRAMLAGLIVLVILVPTGWYAVKVGGQQKELAAFKEQLAQFEEEIEKERTEAAIDLVHKLLKGDPMRRAESLLDNAYQSGKDIDRREAVERVVSIITEELQKKDGQILREPVDSEQDAEHIILDTEPSQRMEKLAKLRTKTEQLRIKTTDFSQLDHAREDYERLKQELEELK